MARRIDPLLDALKRMEADEVRLVVGERIYLNVGGRRQDIGREPLQAASVAALVKEILTPEDVLAVRSQPRAVRVDHDGEAYEATVATDGAYLTMMIRRSPSLGALSKGPDLGALPVDGLEFESTRLPQQPPPQPPPVQQAPAYAPAPAPVAPAPVARAPVTSARGGRNAIDEILHEMISKSASDLHLSAMSAPVFRVHGEITFTNRPPMTGDQILALVQPLFSEKARQDFSAKNDADFAYEVPGLARFRVNVFVDRMGVGAVLRQIPIEIIPADKLGLQQSLLDLCFLTKGLVVVTGPTGSGKSTTLASMIDYVNKNRSDHIITIEDPIEFVHKNIKCLINQREVGVHTQSFKNALRAALREDPDVVLVGEMRDLETIAIAIETAETGHLVFGTLHTTTAVSTVDRIIDQFPADQQEQIRVMLSEALKGVIAQVLCKKLGGGRVAAMEVLLGNHAVAALIREGKTFQIPSVMQTAKGQGMITMNDSLFMLVQKKLIDPKEAWMKAVDKTGLIQQFKNAGLPTTFT